MNLWNSDLITASNRSTPRAAKKTTWQRSTATEVKSLGLSWDQIETAARDRGRCRTLVDLTYAPTGVERSKKKKKQQINSRK
jgi:hypothetical protein